MYKKKIANTAKAEEIDLTGKFKEKDPIEVTIKVTNVFYLDGKWSANSFIGTSDEWPEVKFEVFTGAKLKSQNLYDFSDCPDARSSKTVMDGIIEGDKVKVKGRVKNVKKERMTVGISHAEIVDFLEYAKTEEEKKAEELAAKQASDKAQVDEDKQKLHEKMEEAGLLQDSMENVIDTAAVLKFAVIKNPGLKTGLLAQFPNMLKKDCPSFTEEQNQKAVDILKGFFDEE